MTEVQPREIKILETAEDIQQRREEVLSRYSAFKQAISDRRNKLEDSRRYQYFKRDADELESWIYEKLQTASDESYKDPTNLQVQFFRQQLQDWIILNSYFDDNIWYLIGMTYFLACYITVLFDMYIYL